MQNGSQFWGLDDVAAALDVSPRHVRMWMEAGDSLRNGPMPPPHVVVNLGQTPVWLADEVVHWAIRTGRTNKLWAERRDMPRLRRQSTLPLRTATG